MQTFLPYASFSESAAVLDVKRLGKQRVEVLQLLNGLRGGASGWLNHPAALMWRGYENALVSYGIIICAEWIMRGYKDTCAGKIDNHFNISGTSKMPPWFGNAQFHASHRSNLLRKDPEWYGQFGWTEPPDIPYFWPVKKE